MPSATPRKTRPYAARVPIEQRREQLLDAALTIIDRDGYDRVTIDAIARESDVTRPVVYGAFPDIGALLAALLDRQQDRALAQLYGALPTDPRMGLHRLVTTAGPSLHAMLLADRPTWRAILHASSNAPIALRQRVDADRDGVRRVIADLIAPNLQGRTEDAQDSAEVLAHAVVAVLEHYGRLILDAPHRWPAQRLVDALAAILPKQR